MIKVNTIKHFGKNKSLVCRRPNPFGKFFLLFLFTSNFLFSQFAVTLSATDESCTDNGVLNWSTSNVSPGASIVYNIYKSPDFSNPIAISSPPSASLTGLKAGTYRIVATHTVGGVTTTSQSNATINDTRIPLAFSSATTNPTCSNNGIITVNVSSGRAPFTYEITGPVNSGPQSSNVFTGLSGGNYNVKVTDACNETRVISYQLLQYTPALNVIPNYTIQSLVTCNTVATTFDFTTSTPGAAIFWPLQMQITTYPPGGGTPIIQNQTLTNSSSISAAPTSSIRHVVIPYFTTPYSYDIQVTDACGNVYNFTKPVNQQPSFGMNAQNSSCGGKYIYMDTDLMLHPVTFTILSGPSGVGSTTSSQDHYGIGQFGTSLNPLPDGTYTVQATDTCGTSITKTITLTTSIVNQNTFGDGACENGRANFYLYGAGAYLVSAKVLSFTPLPQFPDNVFPHALPYDATSHIQNYGTLYNGVSNQNMLNFPNYPSGTYVIQTVDNCGNTRNQTVSAAGYYRGAVNVTENYQCSAFSVNLSVSGSFGTNGYQKYYLQKYYPAANKWGHPTTGALYQTYVDPGATGSGLLLANVPNPNVTSALISNNFGTFRVVKVWRNDYSCVETLKEFTYTLDMKITDAFVYKCSSGSYNLGITATGGVAPIGYRIISPSVIENGNNNLFTNLPAGTYTIQVYDSCGNTLNRIIDIVTLGLPTIKPEDLCSGQNGKLIVNSASYLNYEWFNNANPSVILSTSNVLNFPNFNPLTDAGTYSVRLTSAIPNSCINETLSFVVSANPSAPLAGNDSTNNLCKDTATTINLDNYLSGSYENYGTWSETTNSGTLTGKMWNYSSLPAGTYQFKYIINGQCSGTDEAIIKIVLEDCFCYEPPMDISSNVPVKHGITALGRAGSENGNWPMLRNSAFTALESKNKGFVITRTSSPEASISIPVVGMIVFDTDENGGKGCLKIFTGSGADEGWKCFTTQACPEN